MLNNETDDKKDLFDLISKDSEEALNDIKEIEDKILNSNIFENMVDCSNNEAEDTENMEDTVNKLSDEEKEEQLKENFKKIIKEFSGDLKNTFPELVDKLTDIENSCEDNNLRDYCKNIYMPQFFNIIYENEELFENDIELLPGINFKELYHSNISDNTKKVIWKYLQLLLLTGINDMKDNDAFGESAKLFEAIDNNQLFEKISETMSGLEEMFSNYSNNVGENENNEQDDQIEDDNNGSDDDETESKSNKKFNMNDFKDFLDPEKLNDHLSGIMDGKIGQLAKEIAGDAMEDFKSEGIDLEDSENAMKNMFKNPTKLMGLVKKIGGKLDKKMKDGSIDEKELLEEATDIMDKIQDIPGLKNMMSQMGMGGGKNGKMDFKGMMSRMQSNLKEAKTKDRLRQKLEERKKKQQEEFANAFQQSNEEQNTFIFRDEDDEPIQKSTKKKSNNKKKKGKKKKKAN